MKTHNNKYLKSAQLLIRAEKVLAGGVSSEFRKFNHPHALFYSNGNGNRITDVDGNTYLDFSLSQGPLILGHSHPQVLESVRAYSSTGQLFAGQHILEVELAEKLTRLIPSAELVRFCLDGSEAIQTAFRIARSKTKKNKFVRFEGHYHGWLDNVAWGISIPKGEELGPEERPNVFPWSAGISPNSKEDFITLPWNNVKILEQTLIDYKDEIAAIITEPVMCNQGCIEPLKGYLQAMRNLCDKYQIALIFDEVITGFRLGLGGAQQYYGITPDLSVFGKALANGYPISAIVGRKEWMDEISSGKVIHAGTMNSSNPTVAAAHKTLEILENDKSLYPRIFELGQILMNGLKNVAEETKQPLIINGPGPMFNTCFSRKNTIYNFRDTLDADSIKLKLFINGLQDNGIRVIGRGLWYINALHTLEDVKEAIRVSKKVLSSF